MSRAIRTFLALAVLLVPNVAGVRTAASPVANPSCNQDALLIRPVSRTAPQPPSEVVAVSLGGDELDRFEVDSPDVAVYTPVPGRALIATATGGLVFVDLVAGTTTEVPPPAQNAIWALNGYEVRLPAASHFVSASADGPNDRSDNWLIDFETRRPIWLTSLFGIVDPFAYSDFTVSADDTWAVASGAPVVATTFQDPEHQFVLTDTYPWSQPEFHPERPLIAIWVSDGVTAHLTTVDLNAMQGADADVAPQGSWLSDVEFIDAETMLYAVDETVVLNSWESQSRQTFHTGLSAVVPAGIWNAGASILLKEIDPNAGDSGNALGWYLLDRLTGSITPIHLDESARPFRIDYASEWIPFTVHSDFGELTKVFLVHASTGEVSSVLESAKPSTSSDILIAGQRSLIVAESLGSGKSITSTNLDTAETIALSQTEDVTKVAVAPDGCSVAIGVYRVTPDIREATVDVIDLEGASIAHVDEADLIGWSPLE